MSHLNELKHVLPTTFVLNEQSNRVSIGGCDLQDLVAQHGTPLYVYCEETMRQACQTFTSCFHAEYENSHVEFSLKAFPMTQMVKLVEQGWCLHVCVCVFPPNYSQQQLN
jgi:diaminopimelate decarboxylase